MSSKSLSLIPLLLVSVTLLVSARREYYPSAFDKKEWHQVKDMSDPRIIEIARVACGLRTAASKVNYTYTFDKVTGIGHFREVDSFTTIYLLPLFANVTDGKDYFKHKEYNAMVSLGKNDPPSAEKLIGFGDVDNSDN